MTSLALRRKSRYFQNACLFLHREMPSIDFLCIFCSSAPRTASPVTPNHCQCSGHTRQSLASAPLCMLDLSPTASSLFFSYLQLANFYVSFRLKLPPQSSIPIKLDQVAFCMLSQHFVLRSLTIFNYIIYWLATYSPRYPLNSLLHRGRDTGPV